MFDLVNPARADRRLVGWSGQTRSNAGLTSQEQRYDWHGLMGGTQRRLTSASPPFAPRSGCTRQRTARSSVFLTVRAVLAQESVRSPLHQIVAPLIAWRGVSRHVVARRCCCARYCARLLNHRPWCGCGCSCGRGYRRTFRRRRGFGFTRENACRRRFRRHYSRSFGERGSDRRTLRRRRGACGRTRTRVRDHGRALRPDRTGCIRALRLGNRKIRLNNLKQAPRGARTRAGTGCQRPERASGT